MLAQATLLKSTLSYCVKFVLNFSPAYLTQFAFVLVRLNHAYLFENTYHLSVHIEGSLKLIS